MLLLITEVIDDEDAAQFDIYSRCVSLVALLVQLLLMLLVWLVVVVLIILVLALVVVAAVDGTAAADVVVVGVGVVVVLLLLSLLLAAAVALVVMGLNPLPADVAAAVVDGRCYHCYHCDHHGSVVQYMAVLVFPLLLLDDCQHGCGCVFCLYGSAVYGLWSNGPMVDIVRSIWIVVSC